MSHYGRLALALIATVVAASAPGNADATASTEFAHSAQQVVTITEPASQSGATMGQPLTIRGEGCQPSAAVNVRINDRAVGSTTATSTGSFELTFTVPEFPVVPGVSEGSEASLVAECGGQEGGIVLVLSAPQVTRVPTGGVPAAPAPPGPNCA